MTAPRPGRAGGGEAAARNARLRSVPGSITARWPANARFLELGESLWLTGDAIESSERPTAVVGASLLGKSRLKAVA